MKFRPCKYCGNTHIVFKVRDHGAGVASYHVQCRYCRYRTVKFGDPDLAVKAWNQQNEVNE